MDVLLFFVFAFLFKASLSYIIDDIFPPLPVAVKNSENNICNNQSAEYVRNLNNFTLWAHEMRDSSARNPVGLLRGSVYNMGDFTECLSARAPFPTQYCLPTFKISVPRPNSNRNPFSIYFRPTDPVFHRLYRYKDLSQQPRNAIKLAWCIPASCSSKDVEKYLNEYLSTVDHPFKLQNVTYKARVSPILCQDSNGKVFDAVDISFCVTIFLTFVLVSYGTYYDYAHFGCNKFKYQKLILGFSARKNFIALGRYDESNSVLAILNGVRTVSIFMIIFDHRFATFISAAVTNVDYIEKQYRNVMASIIFRGDLFVDSFFVLSGLLVVYGLMNQFDKKIVNPLIILLLRYSRLFPVYAIVIYYYATIFYHSGNGPLWEVLVGADNRDCRKNWWTNLLFISNYVNTDNMCIPISWYLPCDFHYFIIALGICYLIKRKKNLGYAIFLLFLLASIAVPFSLTMIYQRPAFMRFYPDFLMGPKKHVDFKLTYSKSHTRASPYFVGMFAGYVYYLLKDAGKSFSKVTASLTLGLSTVLMLICVYAGAVFYNPFHAYNALESGVYSGLHRVAWAIGSIGFLFVLSFGPDNFLKFILTMRLWTPLSKLVYGAYLTHFQFQLRATASFRNPRRLNYFDMFSYGLSDIILAFSTSLFIHLLIEAPLRNTIREIIFPAKLKSNCVDPDNGKKIVTECSRV